MLGENMIRYLPEFILEHYQNGELAGSFIGYALLFDMADFTPISTEFQKHGKQGAEELSKFLDFVFGEPIAIVQRCGGFVSLFAGDAFCAIFPGDKPEIIISAVSTISAFFEDNKSYQTALGSFVLKIRQTVVYGNLHWQIFENELQNEYVFYGESMAELAELSSSKEELLFSESAALKICEARFEKLEQGYRLISPQAGAEAKPLVFKYSQDSITRFINPKYRKESIQAEIRSAAFCFANLEAIPFEERNATVTRLQVIADNYGGFVNKYDATDKGLVALILFGIPRSEDKTLERICRFALEAIEHMPLLALGLAKGDVYAGQTGSGEVREYTALGHPINLAARLMSIAISGEIITDSYLCQELGELFVFETKAEVTLKGINEPIMSYRLQEPTKERKLTPQYYFVGRDKELADLRQALDEAISTNNNLALYIYGDPGIGKSRLIRELLDLYPEDSYYCFFLYCDAILPKSLEPVKQLLRQHFPADPLQGQKDRIAAYRAKWKLLAGDDAELIRIESILASLLGYEWERSIWEMLPPPERPKQLRNAFLRFMTELAKEKPVLIHLDDGQWIDDLSKDYLQVLSDNEIRPVQIISSCRYLDDGGRPELGLTKHRTLSKNLGILDEEGSRALTGNILKLDELPPPTFEEINSRAMGNPFFIEQLCAYLLEIGKIDPTGMITGELGLISSFSISDIIGSRIDRLTERVRDCVYNASVLGMEFNVQVLSHMLNDTLKSEMELGKANLIWKDLDELLYIFSHILIKDIAYLRILGSRLKTLHQLAAEAMENVFKDALDEHAEEIGIHFDKAGLEERAAEYFDKAGCWFSKNYDFVKSLLFLNKGLQIRELLLGAEHPDTVMSLNNLADLFHRQGKYAEAENLYQRALTIRENVLGVEHPDTAKSLCNLAILYYFQGMYAEAEPLHLRALAIQEKVLGSEHLDTARSLNNLANVYLHQDKYAEAENLYQRALTIRENVLGAEHPDTASSLNNLAIWHKDQGNYAEAEPLYLRALAIQEKVLGVEHPDTARSLYNLANLCFSQCKYAEAEPLYLRALAIFEKVLSAEHPYTTRSLNSRANLYLDQGKYAEAEPLYQRVLAIREKVLGAEHHLTAYTLNNLASVYFSQCKYAEAEPLYLRALAIREKVLGAEHPDTADSLNNLANVYLHQGKYAEAKPLYQRALAIYEEVWGVEHPRTAYALNNMADVYHTQGKYTEAEPLYLQALAIFEKVQGAEHPDTAKSQISLADLNRNRGKYAEAEPLYQKAVTVLEKSLGLEHPWTIEAINGIIDLYERMNLPEKDAHYRAMLPEDDKKQE